MTSWIFVLTALSAPTTPKPIAIPTSAPWADTFCHKQKSGKFIGWVIYQAAGEVYIACERADFKQTASGWKRFQHFE